MDRVVRKSGESAVPSADDDFDVISRGQLLGAIENILRTFRSHHRNALPTLTLRNRAGAAPCPVPMVCIGWALPQFGVPHSVHWSREQMASIEFQNSVVMPE